MKKFFEVLKSNANYLLLIILTILIFKLLEIFCMQEIQLLDNNVIEFFKLNILNERLTAVMKYITLFGDKIVLTIIILASVVLLKNKRYSLYMIINVLWAVLLNKIVKYSFKRIRPYEKLIEETGYSFPSGHAMCSCAFYGLFLYFIFKSNIKYIYKITFSFFFLIIIIIIGISRIYLNVHYLSDVIGGFILGLLSLVFIINMIKGYEGGKI